MSLPKHRARAVESLAHHLCTTDYTDGFCCPRDGLCHHSRQRPGIANRADRNCMAVANNMVKAMEGRGLSVVWDHDPGRHPDPMIDAAERAAIEGI